MSIKNLTRILICNLLFLAADASGQTTMSHTEISGIVADQATKLPLSYVTVRLKTADGTLLKTMLTLNNGSFLFTDLKPEQYQLTLSALGYEGLQLPAKGRDTLYLQPKENGLKEVSITADRPIIKQKAGKIIYDMQADPDSKNNQLLDMMRKIPYVSLDGDQNLLLKGSPDFRVFLNGKPSGMFARDLKSILKSIPASTVQSIEVMTTPPSKYDAEGLAGIINIITIKKLSNEWNGTLNLNTRFPEASTGAGSSFTFKKDKWGMSAITGGSLNTSPELTSTGFRQTYGANPTDLFQQRSRNPKSKSGYLGTELSYEIDTLNLISARLNTNGNWSENNGVLHSTLMGAGATLQAYDLAERTRANSGGLDFSADYQLGFKADKNRMLTLSYSYQNNKNDPSTEALISNVLNYPNQDYRQEQNDYTKENTVQLDYVYPHKNLTIEMGAKGIFRNNKADFKVDNDPQNSDHLTYKQQVLSAYNSYQLNWKSWNLQAGVRLEHTLIDADFLTNTANVKQNYTNLFPTITISKTLKDGNGINAGFSQRMKRPGINRLNPFVNRINPDFETTGNPDLRPVVVNSISLGYNSSKKLTFNAGMDYSFLNEADLPVSTFDPVSNITRKTYDNSGKLTGLSSFIYLRYPLTSRLDLSLNGRAIYFWMSGEAMGQKTKTELFTWSFNLSSGYNFEGGWRTSANLFLESRNPTGFQGTTNGVLSSSFNLSKTLIKDKLSFGAGINNPFTKFRTNKTVTEGPQFYQTDYSQSYFRSFSVNLNYNFGGLKDNLKKNKRGIRNNDLSN
jgi:ferric enterobactin receptor